MKYELFDEHKIRVRVINHHRKIEESSQTKPSQAVLGKHQANVNCLLWHLIRTLNFQVVMHLRNYSFCVCRSFLRFSWGRDSKHDEFHINSWSLLILCATIQTIQYESKYTTMAISNVYYACHRRLMARRIASHCNVIHFTLYRIVFVRATGRSKQWKRRWWK